MIRLVKISDSLPFFNRLGRYRDEIDVLREALRLLEERDRADRLRASIAEADAEIDRGEEIEWTPELMDRLRREASDNARLGKPIDDDVWA